MMKHLLRALKTLAVSFFATFVFIFGVALFVFILWIPAFMVDNLGLPIWAAFLFVVIMLVTAFSIASWMDEVKED